MTAKEPPRAYVQAAGKHPSAPLRRVLRRHQDLSDGRRYTHGRRRLRSQDGSRRVRVADRSFGLRQIHGVGNGRRPLRGERRRHRGRRPRGRCCRARSRGRVPGAEPVSLAHRARRTSLSASTASICTRSVAERARHRSIITLLAWASVTRPRKVARDLSTQDSTGLGIKLERTTWGSWHPHKVKLAVSGCPRNCAEATIKDLGVVCVESGYELHVGGNGGIKVRATDFLCKVATEDEVLEYSCAYPATVSRGSALPRAHGAVDRARGVDARAHARRRRCGGPPRAARAVPRIATVCAGGSVGERANGKDAEEFAPLRASSGIAERAAS